MDRQVIELSARSPVSVGSDVGFEEEEPTYCDARPTEPEEK